MESPVAYFQRKREELLFLAGLLARPPAQPELRSIESIVEQKFRLGAALKAERALADWSRTETSWTDEGRPSRIGPYDLRSSYQRADLTVVGPPIYRRLDRAGYREVSTIYAASGMSSVSTLLLALGRALPGAHLIVPAGAYNETLEAAAHYGAGLRLGEPRPAACLSNVAPRPERRVLLIDSSIATRVAPPRRGNGYDLIVIDTTCLSAGSGRIRRVLNWAGCVEAPIVLARSHTKLDSLGIEYGRLGSAVLLAPARIDRTRFAWMERLSDEIERAVRLFGAAPVPAHLPPFAGHPRHASLSAKRIARIVVNGRRMMRRLARCGVPVTSYQHGLYGVLRPPENWSLEHARRVAGRLAADLREAALPVRHAGSFGFDFLAMDGFPDSASDGAPDRHGVRLAFSDAPGPVADEATDRIARWWTANILRMKAGRTA